MFRSGLKKFRDSIKYHFFSGSKQLKQERLALASKTASAIADFLNHAPHKTVSLGQNCNSAWYLKQVGLKTESYPFDWIISSSTVLESCLDDHFATFMDKSCMFSFDKGKRAGHKLYHSHLFNHRNPLDNAEDYRYYQRCISRFYDLLDSHQPAVFICTLFQEDFKAYDAACDRLLKMNPNIKFVFIKQTLKGKFKLTHEQLDSNRLIIDFVSEDINRGKRYKNQLDDRVTRTFFSGFDI